MKTVMFLSLMFLSLSCFALTKNFDPNLLAQEQPSEYSMYLKNLFENSANVSVSKVQTPPKIEKKTFAYTFRSEIRRQAQSKRANFAGEWNLTVIGKGIGSFQYFLTNVKTGKVIDPQLMTTTGAPLFLPNRALLVISGSVGEKTLEDAKKGIYGGPTAYQLVGEHFEPVNL